MTSSAFQRCALIVCAAGLCSVVAGWYAPYADVPFAGSTSLLSQNGAWLIVVVTAVSALLATAVAKGIRVELPLAACGATLALLAGLEAAHAATAVADESTAASSVTKSGPVHLGLSVYLVGAGGLVVAVSAVALSISMKWGRLR